MGEGRKLLGALGFVSRTFEGEFKEHPSVLDMDANLYIGPADHMRRDEHAVIEVIYHFLQQTGRSIGPVREILRNRGALLDALIEFDGARGESHQGEFRILLFGTYDGQPLLDPADDDLPAGPCGKTINEVKRRFYDICQRADTEFGHRELTQAQRDCEGRFWAPGVGLSSGVEPRGS